MESNEIRDLQRAADRAEAAPWVDFPPTPAWYPPVTGLWAGAMAAAVATLPSLAAIVALPVLIALEIGFIVWYRSYRGTTPTGAPPAEMRSAMVKMSVAVVATFAVIAAAAALAGAIVAALVAFVLVTALVWLYERTYAATAAAARARLA